MHRRIDEVEPFMELNGEIVDALSTYTMSHDGAVRCYPCNQVVRGSKSLLSRQGCTNV